MTRPYVRRSHRNSSPRAWLWFVVPLCLGLSTACLDNKLDEEATSGVGAKKVFIAQNSDFTDYQDWMTFKREVKGEHDGLSGTTTIYVNDTPDAATHSFPIGTILFKTVEVEGFDKPVIHSMAKRGGGFNASGALGWEYFELLMSKSGVPYILWRGAKPPAGEMYQALLGSMNIERPMAMTKANDGDCNSCHADGQDGALGDDVLQLLNES